jgi:2-deoxy-D-gluconate 3-dehydrogenase
MAASPFDLSGRTALVTGGNGGIGLGMATALAEAGATVALLGRNRAKTEAAAAALGRGAIALTADVTDKAAMAAAVAELVAAFGRLDILVVNAGINVRKLPQDLDLADWHRVLDTNLTSALIAAQLAHPHMKAAGGGKIITIGSMMSLFALPPMAAYAASKGGLVQLTKTLACAFAPDNIQANCVLPGWIETELTTTARQQIAGLHERVLARTPAARWGQPKDLGGIAVFLASSASDFVTGTAIPVDGGYSAVG